MIEAATPKQLADHLRLMIDDEDFIVRAVQMKFPEWGKAKVKPKPVPLVQPVVAKEWTEDYVSRHDPATTSDGPDQVFEKEMIKGSQALLEALTSGYGPDRMKWERYAYTGNWKQDPDSESSHLMVHRVSLISQREAFTDTLRVDRDPCTYCGTRADIGCKHRRVA